MYYIVFPLGFIFGLFASSQILYPIFYSLPKLAQLKKEGLLKKSPPLFYTLITPTIWITLTLLIMWLFDRFSPSTSTYFLIGYGISAIVSIIQIPRKNKDLEEDFKDSYKEYLT